MSLPASAQSVRKGELIDGRYRILRPIGQGGMGTVYEARHLMMGRRVALKFMHTQLGTLPEAVERFRREAQAASRVESEHVARVYDLGSLEDGTLYLAMELIEGPNLAQVVRRDGPLPWRRARAIALQICTALQEVHGRGIVHRDLKPANVLLLRRGGRDVVKLVDFGLSKFRTGTERSAITGEGTRIGSLHYMAPEQASGQSDVDRRADVFSVGCILFFMLTGRTPFAQRTLARAGWSHTDLPPVSVQRLHPKLPVLADEVLGQTLVADPARRFGSCAALAKALQPEPNESGAQLRAPLLSRRTRVALRAFLTGAAVALTAGSVAFWLLARWLW